MSHPHKHRGDGSLQIYTQNIVLTRLYLANMFMPCPYCGHEEASAVASGGTNILFITLLFYQLGIFVSKQKLAAGISLLFHVY